MSKRRLLELWTYRLSFETWAFGLHSQLSMPPVLNLRGHSSQLQVTLTMLQEERGSEAQGIGECEKDGQRSESRTSLHDWNEPAYMSRK